MNSNYGKRSSGSSTNAFDFDLGLGSTNQGKPLNGQKSQTPSSYSQQPRPAFQPGKPSWTHQPAPKQTTIRSEIGGPTSMVGDIHGKTWSSSTSGSGSGIGIVNKDPSLFGDLVGSVIGNKSSGNVPLKKAPPKGSYSMGNLADALPKTTGNSMNSGVGGGWGYSGNYSSSGGVNASNSIKNPNLGGPSMKSMSGSNLSGGGSGLPSNGDPFGNLVGFGSKPSGSINSAKAKSDGDAFGTFQSVVSNPSGGGFAGTKTTTTQNDDFGGFQDAAAKSSTFSSGGFASSFDSSSNVGFGVGSSVKDDPLGMFSTSNNTSAAAPQAEDWGFESFEGGADSGGGSTTELDGLPPPPPGVSAASAKSKGIDNQRQGQYADAIKWLSWAVILLERAGDDAGSAEVLSTRASCYKEVGEYKKAVSDCTKVLDHDEKNVTILVQRALLYESMEKYKLGAEDLRMVLKIDPGNRIARSTVHRLTKMAG